MLVEKITLNPKVTSGKIGQIVYWGYQIAPSNATNKKIIVTSSNSDVIEVFENSFRFKRQGSSSITVRSEDGNFRESFVVTCEGENDYISTVQELEKRLQDLQNVLKIDLNRIGQNSLTEIGKAKLEVLGQFESTTIELLAKIKKATADNIGTMDEDLRKHLVTLTETTTIKLNEIKKTSNDQLVVIDNKIKALSELVETISKNIEGFLTDKESDFNLYVSQAIEEAKVTIKQLTDKASSELSIKIQDMLLALDKREQFSISLMENKYSDGITFIESAEKTAIEDLRLEVLSLKKGLSEEVAGLSGIISGELAKAIKEIKDLQDKAVTEISKLESIVKNQIGIEIERAKGLIADELDAVKLAMHEYMLTLKNELIQAKDNLLGEITMDKDNMLLELEREKNRLVELIREEEFKLFQDLHNTQQAIINRIQTVVQGYDAEMEAIKVAKIEELDTIIAGYDELITLAKTAATDEITNMGNSYLQDLLNAKNEYHTILTDLKNTFSTQLTEEKNTHSANLNSEYTTHKNSLDDQVKNPTTGLKKLLLNDYNTHSAALLSEKNTYTANLTDTKNAGVTEITNLKNSSLDEIGRTQNSGLWKQVRDSVIATGTSEKNKVTAEGARIQQLFTNIESNFIQLTDNAIASIGTSDSTGKRGEAITAINSHKDAAVRRIGTSDDAMDGSNPSLRKQAVARIIEIMNTSIANTQSETNRISAEGIANVEAKRVATEQYIDGKKGEAIATTDQCIVNINNTKTSAETSIGSVKTQAISDVENKRVSSVSSVDSAKNTGVSTVNSTKDAAVRRIGTSDTAMDGSSPSVRKDAVDSIKANKTASLNEMTAAKNAHVSEISTMTEITSAEVKALWDSL